MQPAHRHDIYLMLYVQSWTPDDGRKDCPKRVEWYSINSKNCASSWVYYRNNLTSSHFRAGSVIQIKLYNWNTEYLFSFGTWECKTCIVFQTSRPYRQKNRTGPKAHSSTADNATVAWSWSLTPLRSGAVSCFAVLKFKLTGLLVCNTWICFGIITLPSSQ